MDSIQNTMEFYPKFIGILQELFKDPIKIPQGIPSASKSDSISNAVDGFYGDSINNSIWIQRDSIRKSMKIL